MLGWNSEQSYEDVQQRWTTGQFLLSLFIVYLPVDQCMFQCPKFPYICDICKNSKSWVILKALCHHPAEIASESSLWLLMLSLQFSEMFGVSSTFFKTYPTSCISDFTDLTSISLHLSNNRLFSDRLLSQVFQNDSFDSNIFHANKYFLYDWLSHAASTGFGTFLCLSFWEKSWPHFDWQGYKSCLFNTDNTEPLIFII